MHLLPEPPVSLQNDTDKKYDFDLEEFKDKFLFEPINQITIERMKDFLNHRKSILINNDINPYYDMDYNSINLIIEANEYR